MRALIVLLLMCGVAEAGGTSCTIDALTPVAFGTYNPLDSQALDVAGSITYKCSNSIAITIDISAGGSGDINNRRMTRTQGATTPLVYQLYKDILRLGVWGNTATTTQTLLLASVISVPIGIYGRIPAKQSVDSGTYSDTVTITINF